MARVIPAFRPLACTLGEDLEDSRVLVVLLPAKASLLVHLALLDKDSNPDQDSSHLDLRAHLVKAFQASILVLLVNSALPVVVFLEALQANLDLVGASLDKDFLEVLLAVPKALLAALPGSIGLPSHGVNKFYD
jgi:hypothetical protein